MEDDEYRSEEGGSSAQCCDSGYHDEIKMHSPWGANSPALSESDGQSETMPPSRKSKRRATPHPLFVVARDARDSSHSLSDSNNPPTVTRRAKKPLTKHVSVGSIGGTSSLGSESLTMSMSQSWDCQSPATVTDILSSLGFDDFESPQLVPDRFIPKDLEHVKPSMMRAESMEEQLDPHTSSIASPDSAPLLPAPTADSIDLPLGATAETFLSTGLHIRPASPPPPPSTSANTATTQSEPNAPLYVPPMYIDPSISQFSRGRVILETVPEETASDLSPSPRWFSPRVSIDHSVVDIAEGKLGASLQKRKRSLPQRDGYKVSIGSQVESEPESIYFSVTSYDDEIAKERREEFCPPIPVPLEDTSSQRRRRRGVYTPPPGLLSWLGTQQTISEEECTDPEDLPWPFNEQARLRKSLTEIQQAQESSSYELTRAEDPSSRMHGAGGALRGSVTPNSPGRPPSSPLRCSPQPADLSIDERAPTVNASSSK